MDKTKETKETKENIKNKNILVLSGGSMRGIAHIGVLKALENLNILENIKTFAATSVGAMISVLYLVGYTPDELIEFIYSIDFKLFSNINVDNLSNFGMDDGEKMMYVFKKMFEVKNVNKNITFSELFQKTNIKLIITAVCINDKKLHYVSHETYPNMNVLTGLRMTISVPFLFTPVKYESKLFIDGGIMNNYPINLFYNNLENVIGVYLNESHEVGANINNIESFITNMIECIFEGMSCASIGNCASQTINLILPQSEIFSMSMNLEEKKKLYNIGYNECIRHIRENRA